MSPAVIVLTGRKFSGKDTLAKAIFPLGFRRVSFSDQLKHQCVKMFPWLDFDYPQGQKDTKMFNNNTLSPRDIWLKMNVITEIEPNILVRSAEHEVYSGSGLVVITDLRKPEEYEWVKSKGYPIIKIHDPKRPSDIVEDKLEEFIDQIVPDYIFVNNKDQDSIDRFIALVEEEFRV